VKDKPIFNDVSNSSGIATFEEMASRRVGKPIARRVELLQLISLTMLFKVVHHPKMVLDDEPREKLTL
jgi:hypothetical protein